MVVSYAVSLSGFLHKSISLRIVLSLYLKGLGIEHNVF